MTLITPQYGTPSGDEYDAWNQGRIQGITQWGIDLYGLHINEWNADQQTEFDEYGTETYQNSCDPFTLAIDDYIIGYKLYMRHAYASRSHSASDDDEDRICGIEFYSKNGLTFSCVPHFIFLWHTTKYSSLYMNNENDFYYLTGWKVYSASVIYQIQFQFTRIILATTTAKPTANPTNTSSIAPLFTPSSSVINATNELTINPTNDPIIKATSSGVNNTKGLRINSVNTPTNTPFIGTTNGVIPNPTNQSIIKAISSVVDNTNVDNTNRLTINPINESVIKANSSVVNHTKGLTIKPTHAPIIASIIRTTSSPVYTTNKHHANNPHTNITTGPIFKNSSTLQNTVHQTNLVDINASVTSTKKSTTFTTTNRIHSTNYPSTTYKSNANSRDTVTEATVNATKVNIVTDTTIVPIITAANTITTQRMSYITSEMTTSEITEVPITEKTTEQTNDGTNTMYISTDTETDSNTNIEHSTAYTTYLADGILQPTKNSGIINSDQTATSSSNDTVAINTELSSREVVEQTVTNIEAVDDKSNEDVMQINDGFFGYWAESAIISSLGLFCLTTIFCISVVSYITYTKRRIRRSKDMHEQNVDIEVWVDGSPIEGEMYKMTSELPQTDHEISLSETETDSDLILNANLPETESSESHSTSETSDDEMYDEPGHKRQETPTSKI